MWSKEYPFTLQGTMGNPISRESLTPDVEGTDKQASWTEYSRHLLKRLLLIRKALHTIHRDNTIERAISKREASHIGLGKSHIGNGKGL